MEGDQLQQALLYFNSVGAAPLPETKAASVARSVSKYPARNGTSGHLADPKKAWMRILNEAGIKNLRIHDLRRTLGGYQAATGANGYIIGKSLGHKSQQSTAIYARLNLDPVIESVNKATEVMFGYMGINTENEHQ